MAVSSAKWQPCCAGKGFTGRIFRTRQREEGTLQALTPRKRGRKSKPVNPLDHQLRQVQAENRKLKRKLEKAEIMLDIQKKVSHLLGISLESSSENEDES